MATITIEYDARNAGLKKGIELLLALGAKVKQEPRMKNGIEKSLEDIKCGRVREIKDTKAYFQKLGVNV
ncbi:MAG: hypothetical protein PHH23_06725 [Paludibacteraceae bacterium]|nr:hypothetical protein [Paludibacteraceae bacterium]